MTRPVYEPSYARTDRKLGFTGDQLLRRPAPSGGVTPSYAWIQWGQSSVALTSSSWQTIRAADGNVQDYFAGFESDPNDFSMTVDLSTGIIEWNEPAAFQSPLVLVQAYATISATNWATGDVAGVAIELGHNSSGFSDSLRWIDTNTVGTDLNLLEDQHINVSVMVTSALNKNSARCSIYQSSGGTREFSDTFISATAFRDATGTFYP